MKQTYTWKHPIENEVIDSLRSRIAELEAELLDLKVQNKNIKKFYDGLFESRLPDPNRDWMGDGNE